MKLNRTTTETIIIILLAILAVLGIVAILWNQDTAGATGTETGTFHPSPVYPTAKTYSPLTWTVTRPIGGTVDTANGCHTYLMGGRFGSVDNLLATACKAVTVAAVTQKPAETSYVSNTPIVEQVSENVAVVVTETVTVVKPAETVTEQPQERVHCNNGNGNGGEGCNASDADNSNQDETEQRQDNTAGETHGNNGNNGGGNK